LTVRYTAYAYDTACDVSAAPVYDYSTGSVTYGGAAGDTDREVVLPELTPNKRYWWKVVCGAYERNGVTRTLP
jgi:hypothetical protein